MNIKRAKKEIKDTIDAYLEKDGRGHYRIPAIRQRPILLMGAPGIGKTQIMEQIARECDLALVAYTITHHTRQSAIGLPFIREKEYGGEKKSVTEYTMSEIIASVYDRMEASGKKEGILFIDEINCVSETLTPMMLQFLQGKSFGNQMVPEGWIIVAAGNPPEYNKSVRDFDVVTLDRVKRISVEPDYPVWKEYAHETGLHSSIPAYLDIHREYFYRVESTVDGKQFVTARGWEDLSEMIYAYERLGKQMDREVIVQYLQYPVIAKDFANYLDLYYKYRSDYQTDEILQGIIRPGTKNKLKFAPFDERVKVVSLLLSRLSGSFRECRTQDRRTGRHYHILSRIGDRPESTALIGVLRERIEEEDRQFHARMAAGQNAAALEEDHYALIDSLEQDIRILRELRVQSEEIPAKNTENEAAADRMKSSLGLNRLREAFSEERQKLEDMILQTGEQLEHAFDFMEAVFGESQEMAVFITELSVNPHAVWFLQEYDCDRWYMYQKSFLFEDRQADIRRQLDDIRTMQTGGQ